MEHFCQVFSDHAAEQLLQRNGIATIRAHPHVPSTAGSNLVLLDNVAQVARLWYRCLYAFQLKRPQLATTGVTSVVTQGTDATTEETNHRQNDQCNQPSGKLNGGSTHTDKACE